ncbi:hypothetical protein P12x_000301 [Tundrisphaera lichenicola]|uniref:hypothetical protein n=1 Tax=Tundrisphaera lichenicola TaxID=2029860 RepID=UPI003EB9F44F
MMSEGQWGGVARYGLPGLVMGLALAWWVGGNSPSARAQALAPASEASGTIAFVNSPAGSNSQMLYLIDTKAQAFAVYRVEPTGPRGAGTVKLEASRQYRYDLKLSEYNNLPPEASAVEAMVKSMAK